MIIESCNNYIIHKVTQILIIMHYLSKISMQTGQCMYKKQKVLRLSNIICIFAAKSLIYAEHRFVTCRFTDSNGDVPMLTAFPDMKYGLIIDVGRSETSAIGQLATQARKDGNTGIYILQPSFEDTSPR